MRDNQNQNIPQVGMIRDVHPDNLQNTQYSFAMNAVSDSRDGSVMKRMNEPSTIKDFEFGEYKVVGYKNDYDSNVTYFFITNPNDKTSKLVSMLFDGKVNPIDYDGKFEDNPSKYDPLYGRESYKIIIEDDASDPCLGFSLAHPIKTIEIKQEKCGKCIYWTDGYNPPRYVDLAKALEPDLFGNIWYSYHGFKICEDGFDNTEYMKENGCKIACEKLRIFPLLDTPCLYPEVIENGGSLRCGVYQFCIALCDQFGNEQTNYHSLTNPIYIFDQNNILVKDGKWGERTQLGIRLSVNYLDKQASHYKIGVIQNTVGFNGEAQPSHTFKIEGIHPLTEKTVYYFSDLEAEDTTLSHLAAIRPVYKTSRGVATSSNRLLQYGLTQEPEWNLQPVCSLLGHFLKWQYQVASEDLYKDGASCSKYAGYMRDEVYPFAISFVTKEGYRTPVFTLIPPPARKDMLEDYSGHDLQVESVLAYVPNCVGNDRKKKWQFYNTAEKPGVMLLSADECKNEVFIPREQYVDSIYFTWDKKGIDLMLIPNSSFNSGYDPLMWAINNISAVCDNTSLTPDNAFLCQKINEVDDGIKAPDFPDECEEPRRDRNRDVTTIVRDSMKNVTYDFSYLPLSEMKKVTVADMRQEESTYPVYVRGAYLFDGYDYKHIWDGATAAETDETVFDYVDRILESMAENEERYDTVSASLALLNLGEVRRIRQTPSCSAGCSPRDAIENPTSYNGLLYQLLLSREYGPTVTLFYGNPDGKKTESNRKDIKKGFKGDKGDSRQVYNWTKCIIPMTEELTLGSSFNTGMTGSVYGDSEFDYISDFERDDTNSSVTPNGDLNNGDSSCTGFKFHPNISKTAKWVRIDKPSTWEGKDGESLFVELAGNNTIIVNSTSDSSMSDYMRITCFSNTDGGKLGRNIFNNSMNKDTILWSGGSSIVTKYTSYLRTELKASDFSHGNSIWIAIDTQMCMFQYTIGGSTYGGGNDAKYLALGSVVTGITPGPIHFAIREKEIEYVHLKTDGLALRRQAYFYSTCRSCGDTPIDCDPRDPSTGDINYGDFGYWESIERYPANFELYDSSRVRIDTSRMTDGKSRVIEQLSRYYGAAKVDEKGLSYFDGNTPEYPEATTTFCQQPIRHYLFPDNITAPFCSSDTASGQNKCFIYPLGVRIDPEMVDAFLDIAVDSGLITQEQRDLVDGFELYRGDRRLNKCVLGTGIGFDMYKYKDDNGRENWFPNFPYNTLGENTLIYADNSRASFLQHPYASDGNNMFSFCSPDYSFAKPEIGTELRIEGYQYGQAEGIYTEVEDYPRYVLLGPASYAYARKMALWQSIAETAYEVGMVLQTISQAWGGSIFGGILAGGIVGTVGIGLTIFRISMNTLQRYGRYKNEWLSILKDKGVPSNFAFYYSSAGYYNSFIPVQYNDIEYNTLRGIYTSKFIGPGMFSVVTPGTEEGDASNIVINNRDRESSIFLSLGDPKYKLNYDGSYKKLDNSRFIDGQGTVPDVISGPVKQKGIMSSFVASPYMKIKRYIPNQYGSIDNINWLSVGYCGKINEEKEDVDFYGGDIFISRFSMKRKFPLFHTTAWGLDDLLPFALNDYRNIGFPRYFLDYEMKEGSEMQLSTTFERQDGGAVAVTHPYVESVYELAGLYGDWYLKGRMTLYSYGIPQFLVESDINCNFRLKGLELHEQFYPAISDYTYWTQQKNVQIHVDNTYMISPIYQSRNTIGFKRLPDTYERKFWDCAAQKPNGVIWSREDVSENSMTDPWLFYKPIDFYEFPSKNGKLIHMKGIESDIIMARFENQVGLYNTMDVLKERVDPNTANELGTGGLFQGRPMEYNKTDLGYTGSQSTEMVSTEYGHLWVDAKRGYVFMVQPNGSNLQAVHPGISNWLKEYMPFNILKYNIINMSTKEPMTYEDVDNKFIGLGLSLGWDNRFKRVFVTKKDYIPVKAPSSYSYQDAKFYYNGIEVSLQDKQYFEDVSFTIAYSMDNQGWLSYYSFMPDYYIERHNYFQSGKNFSDDINELGIWSHLLTTKSYQVFYGKLYPFIIEMPILEQYIHKIIQNVSYRMEARRYMNEIDYAVKRSIGFNKAWVYSDRNHSGLLHLVPEEKNNMYQKLNYPRIALDGSASYIIQTEDQDEHRFNDFFNRVRDDENGIPLWVKDKNDINKEVNIEAIYYNSVWKDRIRGDWFLVRYSNDKESQFKLIFRWMSNEEKVYK